MDDNIPETRRSSSFQDILLVTPRPSNNICNAEEKRLSPEKLGAPLRIEINHRRIHSSGLNNSLSAKKLLPEPVETESRPNEAKEPKSTQKNLKERREASVPSQSCCSCAMW